MNTLKFPMILLIIGNMSNSSNPALNQDTLQQASPAAGRRLAPR